MCRSRGAGSWWRSPPARWLAVWLSVLLCGAPTIPAWSLTPNEQLTSIESRLQDLAENLPAYALTVKNFADSARNSAEEARVLRQELSEQSSELAALRSELEGWKQNSIESAQRVESLLRKASASEDRLALLSTSFDLTVSTWQKAAEAAARRERVWRLAAGAGIPIGVGLGLLAGWALKTATK